MPRSKLPKLPTLVEQKLTKTGYTRGASIKEIYQNRVTRNNPVLIPWKLGASAGCLTTCPGSTRTGSSCWWSLRGIGWTPLALDEQLRSQDLELGVNALLIYRRRADWSAHRPSGERLPEVRRSPWRPLVAPRLVASISLGFTRLCQTLASRSSKDLIRRGYEVPEFAYTSTPPAK